ncbi:MAG: SDR family NAD(P)-dependent oxidoreductase [Gammaproteobacteria bacterium]
MTASTSPRLEGRRAIVTGAASGIGLATTLLFAEHGCRVLAVDLPGSGLESALAGAAGVHCLAIDVSGREAPERIMAAAHERLGGLDILFNNAGICRGASFEDTTDELWERTLAVNVTSIVRLSRQALPLLRESTGASIINTGSIMSEMAGPGLCAYGTSKHAVAGLSKAMAVDLGKYGIRVNCLQPGSIITGLSRPFISDAAFRAFWEQKAPLGRLGEAEDVARVALFLASEDARFVSGAGLLVDGGARVNF